VLSAETFRREGDADTNRKTSFGCRDQLAGISGHCVPHLFLLQSHDRVGMSSRLALALRRRYAMNAKAHLINPPSVSARSARL
jgi:hypothetical protein